MRDVFEDIDQNLLREYGLIKPFDNYIARLHPVEVEQIFHREPSELIRLLALLDQQDDKSLKVIHTYLELRLGLELAEMKVAQIAK